MRIFTIMAVFLLLFGFPASAQRVYSTLSVADGLADNVVRSVVKDPYGFLWFGTNGGLSRYDGNEFVNYRYVVGQPHSLADSAVQTLLVDSSGRLWTGSAKGLSRYNRQQDNFVNYYLNEQGSAITAQVEQLVEDHRGDIWIASTNSLWKYLSKQDKLLKVPLSKNTPASLNGIITTLLIDQNRLWLGTYDGLWYADITDDKLSAHPVPILDGPVNHLAINKQVMQASTMRYGLVCIDLARLVSLDCMTNNPLNNNEVVASTLDQQGKVLFSVMSKGLYQLAADQSVQQLLVSDLIFAIYLDSDGILWLATDKGVMYIAANAAHFKPVLNSDSQRSISLPAVSFYLDEEIALLGSSNGFTPLQLPENQQHLWQFPQNIKASQVFRSTDGTYWLGSSKGLLRKNAEGLQLLFPDKKDFLWGSAFAEDQTHLWIGTQAAGLIKLDKTTLEYHRVEYPGEQNVVISLYRDSQQRLWIGSYSGGLSRYDPADNSIVSYVHDNNDPNSISSNTVKGIHEDTSGKLWLTTWHGLEQFDPQTQTFRHFTQKDGLPSNTLFGLLVDDFDDLWITSSKGIFKFNTDSFAVEVYDTADGVAIDGGFSLGAAFRDERSGEMYFGGNGAIYFHPDNLQKNQTPPTTVITKVRLNGKDVSYDSQLLDQPVYNASTLTINYPFSQLDFEFAALDFLDPKRNQYQYRLEGWQQQWQSTDAKRRFAGYANLWPGEYVFRVKGSNKDLLWDPHGAVLKVIVIPPWWLTWWAYVLYVILVVGAVYGLVQWRTRIIKLEAAQLENEVKLRTATIAELLEQKERLFTHISHEFRTPLSLILRTVKHFKQRSSTTEDQALITSAHSNTYRLLRMVEQLLELARFNFSAEVKPQCISLADFAAVIIDALHSAIVGQHHRIEVDIKPHIVVWVEADALEKILLNLLSNAIKYTPAYGEIKLVATQDESSVTIVVSDSGPGVAAQDQQDIFKPFVRGSEPHQHIAGTGLGLALVQELVDASGGKVWLQSSLGKGSSFSVVLPRAQGDQTTGLSTDTTSSQLEGEFLRSEKETVVQTLDSKSAENKLLLIEDHPEMLAYLHTLFNDEYQCLLASDGKQGLLMAKEHIPDLIVSDVMMPKVDGISLTRQLKQDIRTSHIPIVLLTAKGDAGSKLDGLSALANDYITKPFDSDELRLKLDNLLRFRALMIQHLGKTGALNADDTHVVDITLNSTEQAFKQQLDDIIEQGYQQRDFTVQQIAKALFITAKQLQRKLKGLFGLTPTEYLRDFRLAKAAQLLKAGERPSDVAEKVGFAVYTYFSTCFGKAYGMSPKQYQLNKSQ